MFCPKCLNNSVHIKEKGVIHILINGRQRDTGRFLYDINDKDQTLLNLTEKVEDHFKWMGSFQNKSPVESFNIITSDASCDNGCALPLSQKFSVLDVIISRKVADQLLKKYSKEFEIELDLEL